MNSYKLIYLMPFIISFLISLSVGFYALKRRRVEGASEFFVLALIEAFSILFYIIEMVSVRIEAKIFWDNLQWPLYLGWGLSVLVFCIRYARFDWLEKWRWWPVLGLPGLLYSLAVFFPPAFEALQPNAEMMSGAAFVELSYDFSATSLVTAGFYLLMIFLGLGILAFRYFYRSRLFQMRLGVVTIGILIPAVGTILTLADIRIFDLYRDLLPFTTAVSNLVIAWGMFRQDLFPLMPFAYQTILESLEDMVFVMDEGGRVSYANRMAEQYLEISEPEMVGKKLFELVTECDPKDQQPFGYGEVFVEKEAGKLFFSANLAPIENQRGQTAGYVALLHNITSRRDVEDQLKLQTRMLEAASNGIVITDKGGHIIWANQAITTLTGYEVEELVGQKPSIFKSGSQSPESYELLWDTILAGKVWKGQIINKRKDGSLYNEELTITPYLNEAGEVTHHIAVKQDVTDRVEVMKALRESEETFRALFERTNDAVFIIDVDLNHIAVNQQAADMLGYTVEELEGMRTDQIVAPQEWENAQERAEQLRRGEIPPIYERVMLHKDGRLINVELSVAPVMDENGDLSHIQSIVRDITARKRQEAELQRLALYDQLTGLPNRVLLYERFNLAVEHAKRNDLCIALLFIDLDNFKTVNDSYGHDVGDRVLQLTAHRMEQALRKSDTVARLSGDEFAIMIENITQKQECGKMAEKVIDAIHGIEAVDDYPVALGASIGISVFPDDGEKFDDLLVTADQRMYKVKHKDKDGYLLE